MLIFSIVVININITIQIATPSSYSSSSVSSQVRAQYNAQPKIVRPIMEAIDGISKSFLALLDRQLAQEKEEQDEEEEEGGEEMPSLQTKMEELVSVNQSLLEALDLSHPALQQVQIMAFNNLSNKSLFQVLLPNRPTFQTTDH